MNDGCGLNTKWVEEVWPDQLSTRYEVADALHDEQTPFQAMRIVESKMFGRMLMLDGMVQTTEKDEFIYHEMMTHVPIIAHGDARKVLIIGGGDGGILREALRHDSVEKAVMVEIDQGVIDFSKRLLPTISDGAFDDPRAEIIIGDGAKFVAETQEKFDVIIVDSPDPIGPAKALFAPEFHANVAKCLTERGIMTKQNGSTWMQPGELPEAFEMIRPLYKYNAAYLFAVPTYVGGLFASLFCSQGTDPAGLDIVTLQARFNGLNDRTRYYNPGVHFGAFQLPGYVKEKLQ